MRFEQQETAGGGRRLRLDLSYDGTDFAGWAEQPELRTVCGELRSALATLFRAPVSVAVAGRTDAGVHATGQVAHIDVDGDALAALAPRPQRVRPGVRVGEFSAVPADGCAGLLNRLAGLLPADVRVTAVTPAPTGFDARFSALRRHYRYRIGTARHGVDPLRRHDTYALRRSVDIASMDEAGRTLLGTNDFAAYCRPPTRPDATTIRDLQALRVVALDAEPDVVGVDVVADAFCHSMVRSIVGVLIGVGTGRRDVDQPLRLLADRRRTAELHVAPAHGLTLTAVDYPPEGELASRAERTRAVRGRD